VIKNYAHKKLFFFVTRPRFISWY